MNDESTPSHSEEAPTSQAHRDSIREFTQDAGRYVRQTTDELVDTVRDKANQTFATVRERGGDIVNNEYDRAIHYIRQNPLTSVSIGVVVGLALGAIFGGRGGR